MGSGCTRIERSLSKRTSPPDDKNHKTALSHMALTSEITRNPLAVAMDSTADRVRSRLPLLQYRHHHASYNETIPNRGS